MKYPALDVSGAGDSDLLLAFVDDFSPTAVSALGATVTVFFATPIDRDRAAAAVTRAFPEATSAPRDVDDEDWARRSQEGLTPVQVGRIVVTPPWHAATTLPALVIVPSMGFGTGHHATTRLCLQALQHVDISDRTVLDVGTGSGVLAMAARLLGAREAVGIDYDADAIEAAVQNLALNPRLDRVRFELGDLRQLALAPADVVTANLTGALVLRSAARLRALVHSGGTLIVSGLQIDERDDVVRAFSGMHPEWDAQEEGWIGLGFTAPSA
jgi:ribosomal protein L11 methyltransferase